MKLFAKNKNTVPSHVMPRELIRAELNISLEQLRNDLEAGLDESVDLSDSLQRTQNCLDDFEDHISLSQTREMLELILNHKQTLSQSNCKERATILKLNLLRLTVQFTQTPSDAIQYSKAFFEARQENPNTPYQYDALGNFKLIASDDRCSAQRFLKDHVCYLSKNLKEHLFDIAHLLFMIGSNQLTPDLAFHRMLFNGGRNPGHLPACILDMFDKSRFEDNGGHTLSKPYRTYTVKQDGTAFDLRYITARIEQLFEAEYVDRSEQGLYIHF